MALSMAPCKCCRGLLHRLPDLHIRAFSSAAPSRKDDKPAALKPPPPRDWSRPAPPPAAPSAVSLGGSGGSQSRQNQWGDRPSFSEPRRLWGNNNRGGAGERGSGDNRSGGGWGDNRSGGGWGARSDRSDGRRDGRSFGQDSGPSNSPGFGSGGNRWPPRSRDSPGGGSNWGRDNPGGGSNWGRDSPRGGSDRGRDDGTQGTNFGLRGARDSASRGGNGAYGGLTDGRRRDNGPRRDGGGTRDGPGGDSRRHSGDKGERQEVVDRGASAPQSEDVSSGGGGREVATDEDDFFSVRRGKDRKGGRRGESNSLLARLDDEDGDFSLPSHNQRRDRERGGERGGRRPFVEKKQLKKQKPREKEKVQEQPKEKEVYIPQSVSTGNLARVFGTTLFQLQLKMLRLGMSEDQRRPDYLLSVEDACNVALDYGYNPIVDDDKGFDIHPDPEPSDGELQPLRPPVVTIMGHVDHGKTTLLDALRHTAVAAGEAGGITQHIGAFSVPLASLLPASETPAAVDPDQASTITFLDTPGHAAFSAMRARGASVTDIVVLVVAADDGVMPQTREVINLVKQEGDKVGLVVAINKCDKPGVDLQKVKSALGAEGIFLEEDGGDVPSVKVSGLKKTGLDDLVETLSTLAEVRDLRARRDGKAEGYVLESRVDKGLGFVATVLVTKGTLHVGSTIVAGHSWCRVRQMLDDQGGELASALPGTPVVLTGWRELPVAGDEILQAMSGEEEAKKAVSNRKRDEERKRILADAEQINAKRREERLRLEAEAAAADALAQGLEPVEKERKDEFKPLNLYIKADVSGTVEAVAESLRSIGNKEAGVKIVHQGVGDVTDSDIAQAEASNATVIGFNVGASASTKNLAREIRVPLQLESVIYRLIEKVRADVGALLPPRIEYAVKGESTVLQLFQINIKGKRFQTIAGCRVNNGVMSKHGMVRVLRGDDREVVFEGEIETLKHLKKDVLEARKGMECGIALHGFADIKEGDEIVSVVRSEVPRTL